MYSPKATALRMILAAADAGNNDSLEETLREFASHRCAGCQGSTVECLLDMLVYLLDSSGLDWQPALQAQLAEVLDSLAEAE
jgi:hypothetical protein